MNGPLLMALKSHRDFCSAQNRSNDDIYINTMPAYLSNADQLAAAIKAKARALKDKMKARWALILVRWKYGKIGDEEDDHQ